MKHCLFRLAVAALLLAAACMCVYAQGGAASSLVGSVVDQSGGVVPGAEITAKNDATGAEGKTISTERGTYTIPSLGAGTYTVTFSSPGFKQAIYRQVVLVAGIPTTLRGTLTVGGTTETVIVEAGAELIQAASATVSSDISVNQIVNLPMATRNIMDFITMLPGVNTTGGARNSSFSNMPGFAVNITIDGVNTQDNYLGEDFFSIISPRLDAIQEVSVSTATPGAESSGSGAVQVRFVTRSGSNEYHGSLYWYHRNPALNSNYWFSNRDLDQVYEGDPGRGQKCTPEQLANEFDKCKAPRSRVLFNQPGFRVGGPIIIPKLFDGRDKAFFFVNYEEFRLPAQMARSRTIYNPLVDNGTYVYLYQKSGQPDQVRTVNLLQLAAANGYTSTWDPYVKGILDNIRTASECGYCTVQSYPIVSNPLTETLRFNNSGMQLRKYPTVRFDFNLTSRHRLEVSWNYSDYASTPDMLNSRDARYPGFPGAGQYSKRHSTSIALRSTITPRIVNELRAGEMASTVQFFPDLNEFTFTTPPSDLGGFALDLDNITDVYAGTYQQRRNTPTFTVEDTITWTKGSHSMSYGFSWMQVGSWYYNKYQVPTIAFGLDSSYDPAYAMFDSTNGPINFPGATNSQISTAAGIYADMVGRVTSISGTAYINEDTDKYAYYGPEVRRARQRQFGFFAQDSWRMRPGLTLNYGLRWEFQRPWTPLNNRYAWANVEEVYGPSGVGNLMNPGSSGGVTSQVYKYLPGVQAYKQDYKSLSPTLGFAWTPGSRDDFLGKALGGGGQTVFRGGFGIAFSRASMSTYDGIFASNPGGSIGANRNQNLGNLVYPGESWPLLYREKNRLGQPDFPAEPTWPLIPSIDNSIRTFDPNIRTPYTMSWSFGVQREITKDTAIEIRYVGNRSVGSWATYNLNSTEYNMPENGFLDEFYLAQQNVYANIAAGRGTNFRYFGPGTGTNPLPIIMAYLSGGLDPNDPNNYTSKALGSAQYGFFTNSSYNTYLSSYNPNPSSLASALRNDTIRRANAVAAGLPANFMRINENVSSAYIEGNSGWDNYHSMQVELRRRMSHGLMVQASYVWAKGLSSTRLSFRRPLDTNVSDTLPHAFKATWMFEMPFGRGKALASGVGGAMDRIIGGWEFHGTTRLQVGNLLDFGEAVLHGMTEQELRDSVGLRFDDANKRIYYYPKEIIDESYKAASYDVKGFTRGEPTGKYLAPADSGGCYALVDGDCVNRHLYFRGPGFARFDLSLVKKLRFTESKSFELRAEFLNAFNNINFYGVSSWGSLTSGQVSSAYTDNNQQQDPGGRLIQFVLRFNF